MLDFWKTIITATLRAVFSWPVALVILGFAFKRHVSALLGRLTRLNLRHGETSLEAQAGGAFEQTEKADAPEQGPLSTSLASGSEPDVEPQRVLSSTPAVDEAARQEMIDFGKNIAVVQVGEEAIKAHLARMEFELNEPLTTEILIRNLAYYQALAALERLYRLIFGSQISLLKSLNVDSPKSESEVRKFYESARQKFPAFYSGYPYESWKGFLLGPSGTLAHDRDGDTYSITPTGRYFLVWITTQGLSENKYG